MRGWSVTRPVLADPSDYRAPHIRLACTCRDCTLPYMTLRGDVLVVESDHRGKLHVNAVSLARLATLAGMRLVPVEGDGV